MAQNKRNTFLLKGTIYDEYNIPIVNVKVKAFDKDLRKEHSLGEVLTDKKGQYLIKYNDSKFSWAEKASADLFIRVFSNTPRDKKEIGKSPVFFNVPAEFTLDFKIDGTPYTGLSEFDTIVNTVTPLLKRQRVTMAKLREDEEFKDISFLSSETGIDRGKIALLPLAFQFEERAKNKIPSAVFYGLFRLEFPQDFEKLLLVQADSISKGIQTSIDKNIISREWAEEMHSFLGTFNLLSERVIISGSRDKTKHSALQKMLDATIPNVKLQKVFVNTAFETESNPEKFWKKLAEKPSFRDGTRIKETKKVLRLNLLTNQPVLAARLYKLQKTDPDLKENRDYAKLTKADFSGHITDLVSSGAFGDFPAGIEGVTPEEKTKNYAAFLEDLVRELYPTDVFKFRLLADQSDPFGPAKADLTIFLEQNPEVEITSTRIDTLFKSANFKGVNDRSRLEKTVKQINRVAKLTTRYDYTLGLLKAGMVSAVAITSLSKKDFIKKTKGAIPQTEAGKIYRKAVQIDQRTSAMAVSYRTANDTAVYALNGGETANVDSIFGDVNLCDCAHCQSVYSPAAYLVDMLGNMRKIESQAFKALEERRADITHIHLTCENTNTVLPYIDLVNEVLENQVANNGVIDVTVVPQTTLSSKELTAFPEHENPVAYDKLTTDFSAPQLPFNLTLDKTRIFLDKLNNPRYSLMELFFGRKAAEKYNDIPIAAEYLRWSTEELMYISGDTSLPFIQLDATRINEVVYYLELTGLTYTELQQLLKSKVVSNAGLGIKIIDTDNNLATCDLDLFRFQGMSSAILKKHLRLARLWKKLAWSMKDLDAFFTVFNPANFNSAPISFNQNITLPLSHALRLHAAFKWSIPQIMALWSGDTAASLSAFNISESEFELYNQAQKLAGISGLSSENNFYRYMILAQKLGIQVEGLWQLMTITRITPFGGLGSTSNTLKFVDMVALIKGSPFSIPELFQLLQPSELDLPEVDPIAIAGFFNELQAGLQAINPQFSAPAERLAAQEKLIVDALGVAFKVEPVLAVFFIADHGSPWFTINAEGEFRWLLPDLVNAFQVLKATFTRLAILRDKLSISLKEVQYFQTNGTAFQISGNWNLPTTNIPTGQYPAFENLLYLLIFRDSLDKPAADWFTLFNPVLENGADAKNQFVDALVSLTKFEKAPIELLVGIGANSGALKYTFPDDFLRAKNVLNIIACIKKAAQLGSTVEDLFALSEPVISSAEALIAENIWKAKYNENDWLEAMQEINKPLREKKRNALVNYLLNAGEWDSFRAENKIATTNDLYAYFLMDVEMSACMQTSRIKQAISNVQLFIDRCLMGLETGTLGQIEITTEFATQWNEWRKVYRVWEANRKIFLYPENWVKPELRNDKSPFFKELESKLTQNDVTDEIAKDALLEYLEKLDTVSNLEVIAFFPDESTKITHVLGRTKNIPHQYFYRKQEDSIWTAWESVEMDIQGDHILLVVWNNRLIVYWGEFTEKQVPNDNGVSLELSGEPNNGTISSPKPVRYLEMKLNWSEYKNGKWGAKKVSENGMKLNQNITDKNIFALNSSFNGKKLNINIRRVGKNISMLNNSFNRTFTFNNCNDHPIINIIPYGSIEAPHFTVFDKMFLKGDRNNPLLLFKSKIYREYFLPPQLNRNIQTSVIFKFNPFDFKISPDHHEIEKIKPIKFFYGNEQSTFYVQPYKVIDRVGDKDDTVIVQGGFSTRTATEPAAISPFTNVSDSPFSQSESPVFIDSTAIPPSGIPSNPTPHHPVTFRSAYQFTSFYHPHVCKYIETLNTEGIAALYKVPTQNTAPVNLFTDIQYTPNTANVRKPYPVEKVDFSASGTYSIYNWELFFHIPFLMATRLNQNQKFKEARKWFHYIFDPTMPVSDGDTTAKRFWITQPFRSEIEQSVLSIEDLINNDENQGALNIQLAHWADNPFDPHIVANFRPSAYMRTTLMKYIDNLIDWADQLFRRDSIESLSEATLLYVLAANLLGKKQPTISTLEQPAATTFNAIQDDLNPFNNAKVAIESFLSSDESEDGAFLEDIVTIPLFCLPKNDELLKYWDTVADRLFKIRNCQNIEGVVRQLPLFEPPIDPGLLVRAANAGLDLNDILNDIQVATPHYRFQVMLQKANEFCNDVKSLGSQFLATYEKRDAEELSLIRSGQEVKLLGLMKDIKKRQVDEAKENIKSLEATRKVAEERKNYYGSREFMNSAETLNFKSVTLGLGLQFTQSIAEMAASVAYVGPNIKVGGPFTAGLIYGGTNYGNASLAAGKKLGTLASLNNIIGNMASIQGGYHRRMDDWQFQAKTAELELKQIDKQLIASEIRLAIAEKDLSNHEVQIEQSQKVEDYLRSKFTNTELYNFMVGQISSIFFQSYQLAYELAKKAEKCMQHELGTENTSIIQFGHWDGLKKGLLSGEKLQYDLRRLDMAYLENNQREYELTKHISIKQLNPIALLTLKATGTCEIDIPEWLYDLDCPGHL